jgi:hypothetical protein
MASLPLYVFIFHKEKIVHDNILSIRLVERIDLLCVGYISIKGNNYRNCPARSFRAAGGHDPDGFCHQLPGNRHLNALDGIYDMWYLNLTDRRPIHDAG